MKEITERLTPLKAIRVFCLINCMDSRYAYKRVKKCNSLDCTLHPFRFGKDPKRVKIGKKRAGIFQKKYFFKTKHGK